MDRDLNLSKRVENIREQQKERYVIHFKLHDIKNRFDESIENIEKKFVLYEELMEIGKDDEAKDILRSQIVFLESAIDFYIHEMTKYSYFKMFSNDWPKTNQYKKLEVSMEYVEIGLNSSGSKDWFFEYITDKFNKVVFLSSKNISNQLNAIGIPYKDVMHNVFQENNENTSITKGNHFINELFQRRNEIVHQNDRSHDSAEQNDIDKTYVKDNIDIIKKIAQEIFSIANAK